MSWSERAGQLLGCFAAERPIDVTAFVGAWPFRPQARTDGRALSHLADGLGLSALWVSHIDSLFGYDTRSGNEALLRETADDPRLVPFAVLDPTAPGWESELEWAVRLGCRGIRLTPGYHGYRPSHPALAELIEAVRQAGLVLHVCVRLEDARVRHPRHLVTEPSRAEVAEFVRTLPPGQPTVLSGLNLADSEEIGRHLGEVWPEGVALDLWFVNAPLAAIEKLCDAGQAGLFCFGSAAPLQSLHATALQLVTARISDAERVALCRGTAARLFDLYT